ncbi:MAG: polysaccharide biosynthesis/export family protein [Cytophagaceae bacterium]|nr:polysaccharide biosynthesis/export family protein [Cytophagaceae bacterium]
MRFTRLLFFFCAVVQIALLLSGCVRNEYRLFRTDKNLMNDSIQSVLKEDNPIFTIHKNDIIELNAYSSNGERIIDPDQEYIATGNTSAAASSGGTKTEQYLVQKDGTVFLPMIGRIKLDGLSLRETDSLLSERYNEFYKEAFIKTRIVNKRVVVIGPLNAKVIKLENEDVNLIEAMALYGGLNENMRTDCIRLIRGNPSNPDVQLIDLSTIAGMQKAQHKLLPGDIIYIQPIKRIFRETMTDILPIVSLAVSLLTLTLLINK